MYLATIHCGTSIAYQIRQSYPDPATDVFRSRLIFDLGSNPAEHMEFMGEAVVFFNSALERAIRAHTSVDTDVLLEKLLWNFLPRPTRERLSRFDRNDNYVPRPISRQDKEKIGKQIHIFDRRRLYYLHYRAIDQSRLYTMREAVCRPLLDQSRDEREYYFAELEKALTPGEYRNYLYAIFNLQRFFNVSFASYMPEALPQDEVADHFIEELCHHNDNLLFWQQERKPYSLHPHLIRYLVMYFDFAPRIRTFSDEYIRQFMNSHRIFHWPKQHAPVSEEKINQLFGQPLTALKKLSRKELNRLYRKKALKFHPDQGGDHDRFIELTAVYTALVKKT